MSAIKPRRTRIAPSPTGFMHIGTLRTMLYDYFLARQSGGQFVIRVEDTDRERYVPGSTESLLATMGRLGLAYDEGPILNKDGSVSEKGAHGPYFQSQRLQIYKKYADQLREAGHAYPCFCSPEDLEKRRAERAALNLPPKYDRRCLELPSDEVCARLERGDKHVVRLRVPEGESSFVDAIRGEIVFQNSEVDDQVLLKSDGFPTYHLAVVVDDHLMNITHVLRGEEWTSSTPKQIILHKMLGWNMPVYAHVPLILNPDKTKLSKRKGDVSVESFLERGYLSEALINYLALLGWNPTHDREVFKLQELTELFDLSKVNKAGAVLNMEKLNWLNGQYLRQLPEAEYVRLLRPELAGKSDDQAFVDRACLLARERIQLPSELPGLAGFLFQPALDHDPAILPWKTQTPAEVRERLSVIREHVQTEPGLFDAVSDLETSIRQLIVDRGWGNGDTLWPLRVALSGQKQSPGPFELLWVYGLERALARIDEALTSLV